MKLKSLERKKVMPSFFIKAPLNLLTIFSLIVQFLFVTSVISYKILIIPVVTSFWKLNNFYSFAGTSACGLRLCIEVLKRSKGLFQ